MYFLDRNEHLAVLYKLYFAGYCLKHCIIKLLNQRMEKYALLNGSKNTKEMERKLFRHNLRLFKCFYKLRVRIKCTFSQVVFQKVLFD